MSSTFEPISGESPLWGDEAEPAPALTPETVDPTALKVRQWWEVYGLKDFDPVRDRVDLPGFGQAISQVGLASLAHLMQRMMSGDTPLLVKDRIALAMAPKLVQEFRGKIPAGSAAPGADQGGGEATGGTGGMLLGLLGKTSVSIG